MRLHFNLLAAILLLISCSGNKQNDSNSQTCPNFLIIVSDNQYYKHVGTYGNPIVKTPAIDKLAHQGVQFTNAYATPSCTPARAALLAGQDIWRLGSGADLWSTLSDTIPVYTKLLEKAGFSVGYEGKGWGPGNYKSEGWKRNPAGYSFDSFEVFLDSNKTKPWSFWLGSRYPARPWNEGDGTVSGIDPKKINVPSYLPDVPEVHSDIAAYYSEIQRFDRQVASAVKLLKKRDQMDNTVIMIMADNGWQMPRGLANLYDFGTHVPLIISWAQHFPSNRVVRDFVKLNDLAPTILRLANLPVPKEYTAKSLLPILQSKQEGKIINDRNFVVLGRERHAIARDEGLGYPGRAIRTKNYLYIHNLKSDRWPAGDPPLFGDIDAHMLQYYAPTKEYMMAHKDKPGVKKLYRQAFLKRPREELFDLKKDPYEMSNVAGDPTYQAIKEKLKKQLRQYLRKTRDPRILGKEVNWDNQRYYHKSDWIGKPRKEAQEKFDLKAKYPYR